ncbi:hypothetical protein HQQ94_19240 [Shewanella sp. VB17]|uniref:hypothetical protein n=1 Tax=Shewanella sp. VB17 TaxID=2739432 RepID=UPI001566CEA7|nr:hypothetical protein [Shewanella sp. VB17]NRD75319.1 hypothetical protein [Shewanella sp. VB17]
MKKLCLGLTLSAVSMASFANEGSYGSCNGILADGAYDVYRNTQNLDTRIALKKWLCSSDEGSENGSGSASLNVFGLFKVGGGGGDVDTWKRQNCSGSDYDYSDSKSTHILMKTANPTIVDAWSDCMKSKPGGNLICYAKETDDSLLMRLKLDGNSGIGAVTVMDAVGTNLTALTTIPNTINTGTTGIRYTKNDQSREAYFDFNGHAEHLNVTCSYTIPKKPAFEGPQECETFRLTVLSASKISARDYQYMHDTDTVPYFSPINGRYSGSYPCYLFTSN